jgi:hypothetical protein
LAKLQEKRHGCFGADSTLRQWGSFIEFPGQRLTLLAWNCLMRALVVLLLVGLSFFFVVKNFPESNVEGAEPSEEESSQVAIEEELKIEEPEDLTVSSVAANPFIVEPEPPQDPNAGDAHESSWLSGVDLGKGLAPGELEVAAALVHGDKRAVSAALGRHREFPTSRALVAEAFALTLEGKFEQGMELARRVDQKGATARELELLKMGLEGAGLGVEASASSSSPMELAMEMSLCAYGAQEALRQRDYAAASRGFSTVILAELDSPWEADVPTLKRWTESLHAAQKNHRWNPKGNWDSVDMVVQDGESPIGVRLRYLKENPGKIMCTGLFLKANRISGHIIQPGQTIRIPTVATGVMVDLSARWALFLMGGEVVGSWPVGIGRQEHDTPTGEYVAGNKLENPPWMRVGQEPIPFGDDRNPLGTRWIGWFRDGVPTSYGLHGTKDPESIGTASSAGCIRFLNRDVELLYGILPIDSPIYVRD